jgi:hypothetical protein
MRPSILFLLIIGVACNNHKKQKGLGKQFFDFDRVIHFSTNVTEANAEALLTKSNLTKSEKYYSQIISGDYPGSLKEIDTNKIVRVSFKKKNLDRTTFSILKQVFAIKEPTDGITMSCMPVYSDILVFVYNKKISGIAKICFGCNQYQFLGQKVNTETFGSDTDYAKLGQILK